jgi:hypothetical protein
MRVPVESTETLVLPPSTSQAGFRPLDAPSVSLSATAGPVSDGTEFCPTFGSDQMVWPEALEFAIQSIEMADFLTEGQRRDILYNNAARFLRLSDEQILAHHGG